MKLGKIIQDYFIFSKGERTGLIVLIIIVIALVAINQLIFSFERTTPADREAFRKMLAEAREAENDERDDHASELFSFDPNTIDTIQLARLDLPPFVKNNMVRYREHGGKFRKADDVRKIYGMTDSIYVLVKPYIIIERPVERNREAEDQIASSEIETPIAEKTSLVQPVAEVFQKTPVAAIDINRASAEDFQSLRGIGPVLSARIVKYRNLLGGFVSVDQLKEVYGLKEETVDANSEFLSVDSSSVNLLDINFLSVDELAAHPYITFKDAQRIVDFRSKNGYISNKKMLLSDSVLEARQYQILEYYLK